MPSKQIATDLSEPPVRHKSEKVYESFFASRLNKVEGNIKSLRMNRQEISDSLGDMGTFIPLLVGMVSVNGLNLASALFYAGVFNVINVITGITF
ncbi:MAG TPA: hypothetical protein VGA94_05095 [Thermodesulfobacteriota bacterium]|jgi:hypothetical protein